MQQVALGVGFVLMFVEYGFRRYVVRACVFRIVAYNVNLRRTNVDGEGSWLEGGRVDRAVLTARPGNVRQAEAGEGEAECIACAGPDYSNPTVV
jgi:hypothetical protein